MAQMGLLNGGGTGAAGGAVTGTNNIGMMALAGGLGGDTATMQAASQAVQNGGSGLNMLPSSDNAGKYINGLNYLKQIGFPVDNMNPMYAKIAKKMIDDSVLGEDQGTMTLNGQTFIMNDKVDRLAAMRKQQQTKPLPELRPYFRNAFFWGTIFTWMIILGGSCYYCLVAGAGLKENLRRQKGNVLLDDLQTQQV
jgi:hypothetical protein